MLSFLALLKAWNMKVTIKVLVTFLFISSVVSCKKPEGTGGNSSIKGNIWVKDYPTMVEYAGGDQDVYIIYGDDISYGDRVKATYDGNFEFKYLRKGNYKIYVYSESLASLNDSAVVVSATITEKKQTVDVSRITIYK
jgi:hypothetical protein